MAAKSWSLTTPADDALKNTISGLIRDVKEHIQTAGGFYTEQQSTPDQTVAIYAGIMFFDTTKVEYAGLDDVDLGTGGAFEVSALTADFYNKILFTIDSSGTLAATEGTENAVLGSVVEPAIPANKFPICMISVQDDGTGTAGTILSIEQSEITQLQGMNQISSGNVSDAAYGAGWNGDTTDAPSKNAVYDEMELKADLGDSIVKGWINFDGTGTISIRDSYNVSSIVDEGTGKYTVYWDTDFANVNYSWVGTPSTIGTSIALDTTFATYQLVGSIQIAVSNTAGARADRDYIGIIAIGDQ